MIKIKRFGKFRFMYFNNSEGKCFGIGFKKYFFGFGLYNWITYKNKFKLFINEAEINFKYLNLNYYKIIFQYLKLWPQYFAVSGYDCDHTNFYDVYKFNTMFSAMKSYNIMKGDSEGPMYWRKISRKEYLTYLKEAYEK